MDNTMPYSLEVNMKMYKTICSICKIKFDSPRSTTKVCKNSECAKEYDLRRKRFKKIDPTPARPLVKRPFTLGCIMNIWEDLNMGKSISKITKSVYRSEEEVTAIRDRIVIEGYDVVLKEYNDLEIRNGRD